MGMVINSGLDRAGRARQQVERSRARLLRQQGESALQSGDEQEQLAKMTQQFPTPRLELDDGNQDLADLHEREDLLLNTTAGSISQAARCAFRLSARWS